MTKLMEDRSTRFLARRNLNANIKVEALLNHKHTEKSLPILSNGEEQLYSDQTVALAKKNPKNWPLLKKPILTCCRHCHCST
jgi:hypothetical protein